ncbi:Gfo/Idh/MocA family oxidoreductase [Ammonicoccus fulvus]|uniref:Gfo/Idh/MocA family oxidoreductase n=1 Tax=Ammonicoccus fulvus TaxID=3138240 RepID=A0ABZ3FN88_9ACTN
MNVRWGFAGLGRMAELAAEALDESPRSELVAVGSRSREKAQAFAAGHGVPSEHAHGTYADLIADAEVDAIYVATPHPQHTDIALGAIAAGKPVLVEKAFTASVEDTRAIIEAARAAGVFCMEAMWTRFNPGVVRIRELIAEGAIGEVRGVHGDLTAARTYDPADRLFAAELGGGAVLDLGVYVISFAQHFLGTPTVVHATGGLYPNGVESDFSIMLGFPGGRSSTLSGGFTTHGPGRMMILGTQGWIDMHPRFHRAPSFTVWRGGESETHEFAYSYAHEFEHVAECLDRGLTESPIMPLADTLVVQEVMAEVLAQVRGA